MSWTPEQIETTLRAVTERSMTDPNFRALALSNPVAAIGKVTAAPVPADFKIQFVDNAGSDMTVVLPDAAKQSGAVSEEELAGVAGGAGGFIPATALCNLTSQAACPTHDNKTACNPGYTKKPGNAVFCPA